MKTRLATLKRLAMSAALAITISFGLIGGQPSGTALADDLAVSTDSEQTVEVATIDPVQTTQLTTPDGDVQAAGAIVQSIFGR